MATETGKSWFRVEAMLSVVMHVALLGVCAWYFRNPLTTDILAAGEGQGGGEGMIEVGTVDGKTLGFEPYRNVSYVGNEENKPNNEVLTTEAPPPDPNAVVLPSTNPTPTTKDKTTDRPTANQTAQLVSQTPLAGRSTSASVDVGRTTGTPVPSMALGVGVSPGVNLTGGVSGVPGGSGYGRLLQGRLGRHYNPPPRTDAGDAQYVIIQLRIARDGSILSLVNGQIPPNYFKRRSSNGLVNNAVVRAVLAARDDNGRLPAFPNGFLMGAQEAVAEVWFRYPK